MIVTSFPTVFIEGEPRERGYQYGSQCKNLIEQSIVTYGDAFKRDLGKDWNDAVSLGMRFAPKIREYDPICIEEMEGVAKGAERAFEEILTLHVKTELRLIGTTQGFEGCTTISAAGGATELSKTLVGKNWDWVPVSKKLGVILKKKCPDGPNTVTLTEAGLLGRDGFNSAGIAIVANALLSDKWHFGVPLHVLINKALRAKTLNDAMKAILDADRASSNNYMLVHSAGEAVCIETAPFNYNVLWADEGILAHSNHFTIANSEIKDRLPQLYPNTLTRLRRARTLLEQKRGKLTVKSFEQILTDHFDKPFSVCLHPDERLKSHLQIQTNGSLIIDLNEMRMFVAMGPPCANQYNEIDCRDLPMLAMPNAR
jgi:isopenicillin-N N-acyltransferase like protein